MAAQSFDWLEYRRLADELSSRPEESCLRTAISRTYYYVLHLARKRIVDNGGEIALGGTHKQVWDRYSRSPSDDCQRLADIGLRLKKQRERADYEERYERIEDDVPVILDAAQDFASRLARLDSHHP